MSLIAAVIVIPIAAGVMCLPLRRLPSLARALSFSAFLIVFALSIGVFTSADGLYAARGISLFNVDGLSRLVCLAIAFFGVVVGLYSLGFFGAWQRCNIYYGFLLLSEAAALAAALADNLLLLLSAWGFLGISLYVLINLGGWKAAGAAKKTLVIVGGSDAIMILGVGLVYLLSGEKTHPFSLAVSGRTIPFEGGLAIAAYLCLAAAAFAKAGAMPLHSWIPDCAGSAPMPVNAFLPASLDKLLGIYLLARISLNLFAMDGRMQLILMIVGAVTIVAAIMMAMVQRNLRKLLGYQAVSGVGYMVLGIGTGIPVGVAGGLFHMVNHAVYKACLFLSGGAVEKRTGTSDLDRLGGLAHLMPVSFACCLVAALTSSGIPPMSGFASKWMVYQGLIEMGEGGGRLWIIWLMAAIFGSALTLATFVKLLQAVFLGERSAFLLRLKGKITEVGPSMLVPMAALAAISVLFGVFAVPVALGIFIEPALARPLQFVGLWEPALATWLILVGIAAGLIIYRLSLSAPVRETESFIGGEESTQRMALPGTEFYETIRDMGILRGIYRKAERKAFDIYDQGARLTLSVTKALREAHCGLLPVYLGWCLAGLLVLLFIMIT